MLQQTTLNYESDALIQAYTEELQDAYGQRILPLRHGISGWGELSTKVAPEGDLWLIDLLFEPVRLENGQTQNFRFTVGLEQQLDFPPALDKAHLTFIGNQLIIQDMESDLLLNFLIQYDPEIKNKMPGLPTINGTYLRVEEVE